MPDAQMPKHVEIAYKDAIDNIIFSKRQQWSITNYTLLVQVAMFGLSTGIKSDIPSTEIGKLIVVGLAWIAFGFGAYLLLRFQETITKFRNRLAWIYETYFSEDEIRGLGLSTESRSFLQSADIVLGLIVVSLVGAIIVTVYACR